MRESPAQRFSLASAHQFGPSNNQYIAFSQFQDGRRGFSHSCCGRQFPAGPYTHLHFRNSPRLLVQSALPRVTRSISQVQRNLIGGKHSRDRR